MKYLTILIVLCSILTSCSKEKVHEINLAYVGTWVEQDSQINGEVTIIEIDKNSSGRAREYNSQSQHDGGGFDIEGTVYRRSDNKLVIDGCRFKIINGPHETTLREVTFSFPPGVTNSNWKMVLKDPIFEGNDKKTYYKIL